MVTDNGSNNSTKRAEMSYVGGLTILLSLMLTNNPTIPIFRRGKEAPRDQGTDWGTAEQELEPHRWAPPSTPSRAFPHE